MTVSGDLSDQVRCAPWIGLAVGVVLVLGAGQLALHPSYTTPAAAGSVPAGGSTVLGSLPHDEAASPRLVRIPAIDVVAESQPVGIEHGALQVPENGQLLGWWRDGAAPEDSEGTVVVAGHVDTRAHGAGALYRLETLKPGDTIAVATGAGEQDYRVEGRQAYRKDRLPGNLFSLDGPPRLALITCGGAFDRHIGSYEYNVVVYAVPV